MKKLTAVILTLAMLAGILCFSAAAGNKKAPVLLDDQALGADALIDGQTVYLPFRAVCEALGYTVSWSDKDGAATVSAARDGDVVSIDVTNLKVTDNGHLYNAAVFSGQGVYLVSGRTFIESGLFSTAFPAGASYDAKSGRIALSRRYENNVSVVNESVVSQDDYLKTTVQYPQLSDLADTAAQGAVNDILKQAAQSAQIEGQKNAADMAQAIKDGFRSAVGMCETYFNYMITYNQSGLLSVVLSDYQYTGGAHGSTIQTSYTFDLSTGQALKLSDLLDGRTDYTAYIDTVIRKEIDKRVAAGDLSEFDLAPFKDIGADPAFYLANSGVVFYFQQYEYFPYAAGIQEFNVSYSELNQMLNSAFRLLSDGPVTLDPKAENALSAGDIGRVTLGGNPTTGYTWHYAVSDSAVLMLASESYQPSGDPGVGSGGAYVWDFKALKAGTAAITFKYYRDWEGEASATAANTVVYTVNVTE
ncbi:inhibitor of cysteine peptidase [Sporobacter termitidis DSM 10068]|uniref:Inhibitor of cysteine peptidase n=1 Tax=Sporobacter termitidis DSM 10068 TaxID=1123282 RepID=A0A1M5UEU4_9FIRM|nr:protease inhibitor I42 family protein [Sporobacter termitidis]SHH61552.1 inhibitor of cysteine peptidase [Sporobacter termitidis DSM 10068]